MYDSSGGHGCASTFSQKLWMLSRDNLCQWDPGEAATLNGGTHIQSLQPFWLSAVCTAPQLHVPYDGVTAPAHELAPSYLSTEPAGGRFK